MEPTQIRVAARQEIGDLVVVFMAGDAGHVSQLRSYSAFSRKEAHTFFVGISGRFVYTEWPAGTPQPNDIVPGFCSEDLPDLAEGMYRMRAAEDGSRWCCISNKNTYKYARRCLRLQPGEKYTLPRGALIVVCVGAARIGGEVCAPCDGRLAQSGALEVEALEPLVAIVAAEDEKLAL